MLPNVIRNKRRNLAPLSLSFSLSLSLEKIRHIPLPTHKNTPMCELSHLTLKSMDSWQEADSNGGDLKSWISLFVCRRFWTRVSLHYICFQSYTRSMRRWLSRFVFRLFSQNLLCQAILYYFWQVFSELCIPSCLAEEGAFWHDLVTPRAFWLVNLHFL